MFKLAILIFSYIIISSAKTKSYYSLYLHTYNKDLEDDLSAEVKEPGFAEDLWVLDLGHALDAVKLRVGSTAEDDEFEAMFGARIEGLEHRQTDSVKILNGGLSQSSESDTSTVGMKKDKAIKQEIMRVINKFVFSAHLNPDVYLTENENSPSLSLFFKGPYTSLAIKYGKNQWHYFVSPPSPLPAWFYEEHPNVIQEGPAMYVEVPKVVENQFYNVLLQMLNKYLNVPL